MAQDLYTSYKEGNLDSSNPDLSSTNIKLSLMDAGTVALTLATHDFWDDVSSASLADSANLSGKSITAGVFDATDVTWSSVTGATGEYVALWQDSGTPSTSPLIMGDDTATGLPVTPNGGDITYTFGTSIFTY